MCLHITIFFGKNALESFQNSYPFFVTLFQMMQNLDELFEKSEFSAQVCAETGRFGINVFVFEPNLQTFDRLMDLTKQVKGRTFKEVLPLSILSSGTTCM